MPKIKLIIPLRDALKKDGEKTHTREMVKIDKNLSILRVSLGCSRSAITGSTLRERERDKDRQVCVCE